MISMPFHVLARKLMDIIMILYKIRASYGLFYANSHIHNCLNMFSWNQKLGTAIFSMYKLKVSCSPLTCSVNESLYGHGEFPQEAADGRSTLGKLILHFKLNHVRG